MCTLGPIDSINRPTICDTFPLILGLDHCLTVSASCDKSIDKIRLLTFQSVALLKFFFEDPQYDD